MFREKTVRALAVACMAALLATGCMEEGSPAAGDEAGADQSAAASADAVSEWPGWVPSMIPEYRYGTVLAAVQEDDGGSLVFVNVRMDQDPYESYRSTLLNSGWVVDQEDETDQGRHLSVVREDHQLMYAFPHDGQGVAIHYFIGRSAGSEESASETGDAYTIQAGGVTMSNQEIPESYPHEFLPIYQPSDVLVVNTLDDGSTRMYVIMMTTEDSIAEVVAYYEGLEGYRETIFNTVLLESADGGLTAAVAPETAEAEHIAQGYRTMFMITIQVGG